jgi:hypothetical protein
MPDYTFLPHTPPGVDTTYPLLGDTPQGSNIVLPVTPSNVSEVAFAPHASRLSDYHLSEKLVQSTPPFWRRPLLWVSSLAVLGVIVVAVVVPVYFSVIKPNQRNSTVESGSSGASNGNSGSASGSGSGVDKATSGGSGSIVTLSNGTQVTFTNNFGGYCTCIFFLAACIPCHVAHILFRTIHVHPCPSHLLFCDSTLCTPSLLANMSTGLLVNAWNTLCARGEGGVLTVDVV